MKSIIPEIDSSAVIAAKCAQRIRGLREHVPEGADIRIAGVVYTKEQVIAAFQAILDAQAALVKSRAQVAVDLAARQVAEGRGAKLEFPLKTWALNYFGAESEAVATIGYAAPKKAVKSPEAVAKAVRLAKATREARGTMGKRQRERVKGVVEEEGGVFEIGDQRRP
jgi:hypothetical protein